jgi:putative transposase
MFINDLKYKCDKEGINCIIREESYTSKASFFDFDNIPVYNKSDKTKYKFSGKRIKRGLYQTDKVLINADVNGSCNIIRKEFPDAFNNIDLKYLLNPIKVTQMTSVYGIVGV